MKYNTGDVGKKNKKAHKLCFLMCVLFWFMTAKLCLSIGSDTLSKGQSLSGSQTLISKDEIFELGFFTTGTSSSQNIYLGIWYKYFPERTTVWVANRQTPLPNTTSTSTLEISQNGNLGLFNNLDTFWSTNLMSTLPDSTEAVLLDNGNFVLRDRLRPRVIFWQSFDHPTDTWLPESSLGFNKINGRTQRLVAWKNTEDPSPGMYSIEISQDETNEVSLLWNMSTRYLKSGAWNGIVFGSLPELSYILNVSFVSNENETYYTYSLLNYAVFSRLVITPSGRLEQLTSLRNHNHRNWTETYVQPNNATYIFGFCGAFGIYTGSPSNPCTCLQGFAPVSTRPNEWWSGCSRNALLQCGDSNSNKGKDGFLKTSIVKLPANPKVHPASNAKQCESACLQDCSCTAYTLSESGCLIWDGNLLNLHNDSSSEQSLYLKVANSELRDAKGKKKIMEVIVAVVVPVVVSGGLLGCFSLRCLILQAWELWISNRGVELLDPAVGSTPVSAVLRYINVGLLCVQEDPNERPNMSVVISMISNEIVALPAPKQPAFSTSRRVMMMMNNSNSTSINGLTVSTIAPR